MKSWPKHTGQPLDKISQDTERDYFMSSEEAKRYGLIDEVITRPEESQTRGLDGLSEGWRQELVDLWCTGGSGINRKRLIGTCVCSFCGKSRDEVRKLIAGPTVYICDECVNLCNIIAEDWEKAKEEISSSWKEASRRSNIISIGMSSAGIVREISSRSPCTITTSASPPKGQRRRTTLNCKEQHSGRRTDQHRKNPSGSDLWQNFLMFPSHWPTQRP